MRARIISVIVLICSACGPVVASDGAEGSTTSDAMSQTSGGLDPSTTGTLPPGPMTGMTTTVGTSVGTTIGVGSSSESSSDEVGGFITDPDGGCLVELPDGVLGHCSIECSLQDQDCGLNEACRSWANDGTDVWNANRCVPVDPDPAGVGEPCVAEDSPVSGLDTCDQGLMCWTVDPKSLEGTCAQYCGLADGDPTCIEPGTTCFVANDGSLPLCLQPCDPLAPTCAAGFGCYPGAHGDFACIREGDRVHVGGLFHPECPSGTFWATAEQVQGCNEEEPCCTAYCSTAEPSACGLDLECVAFFDEPTPEFESLGYCR